MSDENPTAFPAPTGCGHDTGMTLRDYFAAAALHGMLANPEGNRVWHEPKWAEAAYAQADAMLTERSK